MANNGWTKFVVTVARGGGSARLEEWNNNCRDCELIGDRIKKTTRRETPEEAWNEYYTYTIEGQRHANAICPTCGIVVKDHGGCMPCPAGEED